MQSKKMCTVYSRYIGLQSNLNSGVFKHGLRKNGHRHSEVQNGLIHGSFHE